MSGTRVNNVSIKLTDNERERAEHFANERDLTLSEYFRMSALKHRIKPTVVQINKTDHSDKIAELEKQLEEQRIEFNHSLKPLAKYIKNNGYMQWSEYREDDEAIDVLRRIRLLRDTK